MRTADIKVGAYYPGVWYDEYQRPHKGGYILEIENVGGFDGAGALIRLHLSDDPPAPQDDAG